MSSNALMKLDWERHKPLIWDLHKGAKGERKSTDAIRRLMEKRYGFIASKKAFDHHFVSWGWGKNLTSEECFVVSQRVDKRKREGKESEVEKNGLVIPNIERRLKRARLTAIREAELKGAETTLPDCITVRTPSSSEDIIMSLNHLPWMLFMQDIDSALAQLLGPFELPNLAPIQGSRSFESDQEVTLKRLRLRTTSPMAIVPGAPGVLYSLASKLDCLLPDPISGVQLLSMLHDVSNNQLNYGWSELRNLALKLGTSQQTEIPQLLVGTPGRTVETFILLILAETFCCSNLPVAKLLLPRVQSLINEPFQCGSHDYISLTELIIRRELSEVFTQNGGIYRRYKVSSTQSFICEFEICGLETFQDVPELNQGAEDDFNYKSADPPAWLAQSSDVPRLGRDLRFLSLWLQQELPHGYYARGDRPMFEALGTGSLDELVHFFINFKDLLEIPICFVQTTDLEKNSSFGIHATILQMAIWAQCWDLVASLLDAGASPNTANRSARNKSGNDDLPLPVDLALESGNVPLTRYLLSAGARTGDVPSSYWRRSRDMGSEQRWDRVHECSLVRAILLKERELVRDLVQAGADLDGDYDAESVYTPLNAALETGDLELAKYLHLKGAQISVYRNCLDEADTSYSKSTSALTEAIENGHDPFALFNITIQDINFVVDAPERLTALTAALSQTGDFHDHGLVVRLIQMGADVHLGDGENTPLSIALRGCEECLRILINAGVKVDAHTIRAIAKPDDSFYWSDDAFYWFDSTLLEKLFTVPLHAWFDGLDAMEPAAESVLGHELAREALMECGLGRIARVLQLTRADLTKPCMVTVFNRVMARSDWSTHGPFERLIHARIQPNHTIPTPTYQCCGHLRKSLWSPLKIAAMKGRQDWVELLLKEGAEPYFMPAGNGTEEESRVALAAAAANGHVGIMRLLISAGANPYQPAVGMKRLTAMQHAVLNQHLEAVQFLLHEVDVSPNEPACEHQGFTALQLAAAAGNFPIAVELLKAGANVNAVAAEDLGLTALEAAAAYGRLDMVGYLLLSDADIGISEFGRQQYSNAIHLASQRNRQSVKGSLEDERYRMHGLREPEIEPSQRVLDFLQEKGFFEY